MNQNRNIQKKTLGSVSLFWQVHISINLLFWQIICQICVVRNALKSKSAPTRLDPSPNGTALKETNAYSIDHPLNGIRH